MRGQEILEMFGRLAIYMSISINTILIIYVAVQAEVKVPEFPAGTDIVVTVVGILSLIWVTLPVLEYIIKWTTKWWNQEGGQESEKNKGTTENQTGTPKSN